jgi:hypothetical protein
MAAPGGSTDDSAGCAKRRHHGREEHAAVQKLLMPLTCYSYTNISQQISVAAVKEQNGLGTTDW